jgi:hypothetical protein
MRKAYRILADLIAVGVVIQSMAMVWAIAGLFHWVDGGGTLDSAVYDSWDDDPPDFSGAVGFMIHGMVGMMVIPVIVLALLVVAFFAQVPGGVKWAATAVGIVVLQLVAGLSGPDAPWLGLVHGFLPFALFGLAMQAAKAAHPTDQAAMAATP